MSTADKASSQKGILALAYGGTPGTRFRETIVEEAEEALDGCEAGFHLAARSLYPRTRHSAQKRAEREQHHEAWNEP